MSATAFQRMRRERIAKMRAETEVEKPVDNGLGKLTNKELMAILDEKGIEYDKKANKATLISLIEQAQEIKEDDPEDGQVDPENQNDNDPDDEPEADSEDDDEGAE